MFESLIQFVSAISNLLARHALSLITILALVIAGFALCAVVFALYVIAVLALQHHAV